jgi:hypothetical protein
MTLNVEHTTNKQNSALDLHAIETVKIIPLTVRLVSSVNEFSELEDVWDRLAIESSSTIYQTFEWSFYWWKSYSTKRQHELYILLFYDDTQLVGIAPLFIYKETVFGIPFTRCLGFLGCGTSFEKSFGFFLDNGPSDYLDVLIMPKYESIVAEAFLEYLSKQHDLYDKIQLLNVREDGQFYRYIFPRVGNYNFTCHSLRADCCPYIRVPLSLDSYLQGLPVSVRRRFTQTHKAAVEESLYSIHSSESNEEYRKAFSDLIQLHQDRWNRLGYRGFFGDDQYREFFTNIFWAFLSKGWLWFKTANSNNQCIAGRLAFKFNNQYYDYLSGFDDLTPAAKRRPGLALLLNIIQEATKNNSSVVDLLRGDESYKFELTSDYVWNWNIRLTNQSQTKKIVSFLKRILTFFMLIPFLIGRELKLLEVQRKRHGFLSSFFHYIKFRYPHVRRKIVSLFQTNQKLGRGK